MFPSQLNAPLVNMLPRHIVTPCDISYCSTIKVNLLDDQKLLSVRPTTTTLNTDQNFLPHGCAPQ